MRRGGRKEEEGREGEMIEMIEMIIVDVRKWRKEACLSELRNKGREAEGGEKGKRPIRTSE